MNKERILIVEDDIPWIENYQRWLKYDDFDIHVSNSSSEALEKLRTAYYALVILDLALDPKNPKNRDSLHIQKYLKRHPEGTMHMLFSATAEKEDVADAAFKYSAINAFFKPRFEDPTMFVNSVRSGIKKSQEQRPDFVEQAYKKLMGSEEPGPFEFRLLKSLKPRDGAAGYLAFKDEFLRAISPLEVHKTRMQISIINDQLVFALCWSRGIGSAISICLTNSDTNIDIKKKAMVEWLGWDSGEEWKLIEKNNIKGYIHIEKEFEADDFLLPEIIETTELR